MTSFRNDLHVWHSNFDIPTRQDEVVGHAHENDHTTICYWGWFGVLVQSGPEAGRLVQLAHPYYDPAADALVPVRLPDVPGLFGPELSIAHILRGAPVPPGGTLLPFEPDGHAFLIRAGVTHSIKRLSQRRVVKGQEVGMAYLCLFNRVDGPDQIRPYS